MKGVDHSDLRGLVERLEHRRLTNQAATMTMAALGLIGFGVMLVPVFSTQTVSAPTVATEETAAPQESPYAHVALIGKAAIVYDLSTGKTLYEKNAQTQLPLASLTKLLTMYAAVTTFSPKSPIVMTPSAIAQDGDSGLSVGETFAFNDLARFALVASSNDAADAIAEAAAGVHHVPDTDLLASAAASAGLTNTYALNGTGLDVNTTVSGGYGTATDVAKLAAALLQKAPSIASATIEPSITIADANGVNHTLPNTNQDIIHVPNPLLSKTGFTDLAGGNLVVIFDAGINHPVAVVVLGSTRDGRFTDVDQLVSRTLDHFAEQ